MTKSTPGVVQSVDRALSILAEIADDPNGLRVTDIAAAIELPVSTVHRLLTTMERRGFVQQNPQNGQWLIGWQAHRIGERYALHDGLVLPALPAMRHLRDLTRETVNLGVIQAEEAVTIAQVESREIMRAIAPPGGRVPVLNSGMGKALVACWPDEAIERLIERQGLRPMTARSLSNRQDVLDEIAQIRAQGYAIDDEEFVIGMRCVAVVIPSLDGEPIAALSVSGLAARLTRDLIPDIAEKTRDKAQDIFDKITHVSG
jgi:IclR family acetate operon transcriptional repressor